MGGRRLALSCSNGLAGPSQQPEKLFCPGPRARRRGLAELQLDQPRGLVDNVTKKDGVVERQAQVGQVRVARGSAWQAFDEPGDLVKPLELAGDNYQAQVFVVLPPLKLAVNIEQYLFFVVAGAARYPYSVGSVDIELFRQGVGAFDLVGYLCGVILQ